MNQELTPKEIVEKDFSLSMRGYNPTEVDEYLDIIIRDYDAFITEINNLRDQVEELEDQVDQAASQATAGPVVTNEAESISEDDDFVAASETTTISSSDPTQATNFDILKRISNLERHVFGSKLNADDE